MHTQVEIETFPKHFGDEGLSCQPAHRKKDIACKSLNALLILEHVSFSGPCSLCNRIGLFLW